MFRLYAPEIHIVDILPSRDAVKDVMFQVSGLGLKAFTKGRSFLGLRKP